MFKHSELFNFSISCWSPEALQPVLSTSFIWVIIIITFTLVLLGFLPNISIMMAFVMVSTACCRFYSLERREAMILHSSFRVHSQVCRWGWMDVRGIFHGILAIWVSGEVTLRGFGGADRGQRGLEPGLGYWAGLNWEIIQFERGRRAGLLEDGGGDASKLWGASVGAL